MVEKLVGGTWSTKSTCSRQHRSEEWWESWLSGTSQEHARHNAGGISFSRETRLGTSSGVS